LLWLLRNTGHEGFTVHPDVLDQVSRGGLLGPRKGGSASLPAVPSQVPTPAQPPRAALSIASLTHAVLMTSEPDRSWLAACDVHVT
jgi:hypothetical protein